MCFLHQAEGHVRFKRKASLIKFSSCGINNSIKSYRLQVSFTFLFRTFSGVDHDALDV